MQCSKCGLRATLICMYMYAAPALAVHLYIFYYYEGRDGKLPEMPTNQ